MFASAALTGCSAPSLGEPGPGTVSAPGTDPDPGPGTTPAVDPGNDGHDQLVGPSDGSQTQGKYLLGETLDRLGHEPGYLANLTMVAVTADGQPVTVVFDGSAALRSGSHRGADPFFDGMILSGSEGARLRLGVVRGGSDVAFYRIELATPSGWSDLCGGGDAVPLAGKWQRTGFHEHAASRFSFACADSVAYKCTEWGYLAGADDTSLGWRAHQACTRMARGDYCANGQSHTRPGTRIQIYDLIGVAPVPPAHFEGVHNWPPDVGRMFFEAAWSDSAHPASCLSRLRWQSLPLGDLCQTGELRDPRLDTGARFCEDIVWPAPGGDPPGALLFNASYYDDLALHVWQHGDDLVSTVRGYAELPHPIQPFPNIADYAHVRSDGIVLRVPREGSDPAGFSELRLYGRDGDLVVAGSAHPPPGFVDLGFEGYARKDPVAGFIPLVLYASERDYLSTTGAPPAGYALQWPIGYIAPPEPAGGRSAP